jgi:hypothetical protein
MSLYSTKPLPLTSVHTYPLASRKSKVHVRDFAKPPATNSSINKFLDSLPSILAGRDFRDIASAIHQARRQHKCILWGIGGHVIKVGLGPVLINLMRRGFISGIAMNGASLIHDFEIALAGKTSEDVGASIADGRFGMAEETGRYINEISKLAARIRIGYGEAAGQFLNSGIVAVPFAEQSVLAAAYKLRIPVSIHLAIGTDIPHMHPSVDAAALGTATYIDFRLLSALVKDMHPGGVYLNWGSAVILPEIFLKAVSVVRNLGIPLRPITTANFDFVQHYRPLENVVRRPTANVSPGAESHGYAVTGHHEILMPLLAAALAAGWGKNSARKSARAKTR